jgi:hypothetical protein
MFIPDPGTEFFNPGSGSASKNLNIFNPKIDSTLSEI